MDQKKTLWIIAASGVFLAVVILAALILNKPNASSVPATASITTIEKPQSYPVPQSIDEQELSSLDTLSKEALDNLNNVEGTEDVAVAMNDAESSVEVIQDGATVTIDLNEISEVSSVTPQNKNTAVAMQTKKQNEKPDTIYTAAPVNKNKETSSNTSFAKEKNNSSMQKSNEAKSYFEKSSNKSYVETTKYWVQCASYTSKKTADNARLSLDENRIPAEVFTFKDAKNTLYYRVRVGPYTTKSEAEYWKNRILQLDAFKNSKSYITMN